jgi:hypothetical protein
MTTPTFTTTDIVNFAAEKDAVNITSAFNDLIGQRVWDNVQSRKTDLAKNMFNPQAESQDMEAEAQPTAAEANVDNEGQSAETEAALDAAPVETEAQAEPQAEEPVVASAEEQPNTETEAA